MTETRVPAKRGPKGGTCGGCGREVGALANHQRYCLQVDHATLNARTESLTIRAGAHARPPEGLRAAQRFQNGVTDLDVARALFGLEQGTRPYRNTMGRWFAPTGSPMSGINAPGRGRMLSSVVNEMIRTGLVRHYRNREGDHLLPAPVHYLDRTDGTMHSACLFVGEDMGPMRARLVDRLDLVDCLACEAAIATGSPRKL
jgi:hypothetical protein